MPRYLELAEVIAFHQMVMERTGSKPASLRDEGLLESALMRPQSAAHYESADLIRQVALLAVAISQAQAFMDGNKRTAYAASDGFLRLNGYFFSGDPIDFAKRLEEIASQREERAALVLQFEKWLRDSVTTLSESSNSPE